MRDEEGGGKAPQGLDRGGRVPHDGPVALKRRGGRRSCLHCLTCVALLGLTDSTTTVHFATGGDTSFTSPPAGDGWYGSVRACVRV